MNAFKALTQQLALQVDRKILQTEEAGYLRLDLSAHEKASVFMLALRQESAWVQGKRFIMVAFAFYVGLFMLTNVEAYAKIALANIQANIQEHEAQISVVNAMDLSKDPWTGERFAQHVEQEEALAIMTYSPDPLSSMALELEAPTSYENRISIPSLNINAPMIEPTLGLSALEAKDWTALEEQIHDALLQGVVHYPGTSVPGEKGNALLTGHSSNVFWEQSDFNTVFALLPKINVGEDIEITYNQTVYRYRVTTKKEVNPSDVSVFKQSEGSTLTLVTCTPVGTTLKRLIVTAELIAED